jgi:hypothetical protein
MSRFTVAALAVPVVAAAMAGCGSTSTSKSSPPTKPLPAPQSVSIVAGASAYTASGLDTLKPGYVRFTVRNGAKGPEGMDVIALDQSSLAEVRKLLSSDMLPAKLPVTLVSGPPQLDPGESWQGTVKVVAGRYLLVSADDGSKPYQRVFTVAPGATSTAPPPATVGSIAMSDFHFDFQLPSHWNGQGVVAIPNVGTQLHEITLVKAPAAAERGLYAELRKTGDVGAPPKGAKLIFALGEVSAGQTTYVRMNLAPGRYLAVCLAMDPKTMKSHTVLGMISYLTVS